MDEKEPFQIRATRSNASSQIKVKSAGKGHVFTTGDGTSAQNSDESTIERADHENASINQAASFSEYHFSEQIGHLLRRAYQRHVAIFQQHISDSNLTAAQFVTLCAIRDLQVCSLSEIVKITAIDQATIRGIIERLKSRDLIVLSHDNTDRRKVLVSLSESGTELVVEMLPFATRISEATYGGLNPAERIALVFLLRKMIER